jgi:HEAT repeat protein
MKRGDLSRGRSTSAQSTAGWLSLVTCATLLGCGEAPDLPQPIERTSPTTKDTLALAVSVEDGLVTVRARDASIEAIVQEIARQDGLTVATHQLLDKRVTLDIERLPLEEALDRILRDGSFMLSATRDRSLAGDSSRKLWVFSTASGAPPPLAVDNSIADQTKDPDSVSPDELTGPVSLALADSNATVRADAVSALGSAHDNPQAAALAHSALSDTDPAVREEAAYALGQIGGEMSLRALAQALRDPQRDVKQTAIEALASMGGDQAALALAPVLDDPDPRLRAAAVDALGEIAGDTAMRLLQKASADTNNDTARIGTIVQ